jgi:hypothetical protein
VTDLPFRQAGQFCLCYPQTAEKIENPKTAIPHYASLPFRKELNLGLSASTLNFTGL